MEPAVQRQDLSFLQCYICFQNVKKPRMCPSCSKLACQHCLRTWIEESKPECPHCRKPLLLGSFADCERFVNDIKHLLSSMDSNQKVKQKCPEHAIEMSYFCEGCVEPICSDCGMFGKHRGHTIIHLTKVYQQNKNKILNELAKFDNKIEMFRKNGTQIKQELQRLHVQVSQKKNFIQEYFVGLIERIDEEYKQKKERIQGKFDENLQEIEFLQNFRDNICQDLECRSQKELINKSEEFIKYIRSLCDRESEIDEQENTLDTIHELVPKFHKFTYVLLKYSQLTETIIYSDPQELNGIEWRLKIYPRGNGVAKNSHLSVFLQLSKGYQNHNKYDYKIQLLNHLNLKESIVREYSSTFDIGQCWGYNQFIAIPDLTNGFLLNEQLHFNISLRNPSYRTLVRDQQKYIQVLQNKLVSNQNPQTQPQPQLRTQKMNQLAQEFSQQKQEDFRLRTLMRSKQKKEEEHDERESEQEEKKVEESLGVVSSQNQQSLALARSFL